LVDNTDARAHCIGSSYWLL